MIQVLDENTRALIAQLDEAIGRHPTPVGGIFVSSDLWRGLNAAGRIKWKRAILKGTVDVDLDFDLATINEKIVVQIAHDLDGLTWRLPSGA